MDFVGYSTVLLMYSLFLIAGFILQKIEDWFGPDP